GAESPAGHPGGRPAAGRTARHGQRGGPARRARGSLGMKTAVPIARPVPVRAAPVARPRLADYVTLTKPRISVVVLFTVGTGVVAAAGSGVEWLVLVHAVLGTALVASGASALNQWVEARTDGLMRRTENRPLPAGRLSSAEVLVFGLGLGLVGVT